MPAKSLKQTVYDLPLVGHAARTLVFLLRVPHEQERINATAAKLHESQEAQKQMSQDVEALKHELSSGLQAVKAARKKLEDSEEANRDLQYQIRMLQKNTNKTTDSSEHKPTLADNHLLDKFYVDFEDIFRGTEEDIYNRLKVHLPRAKDLAGSRKNGKLEILDIGCGRGEFLKLMKEQGYSVKGLDLNAMMVKRAQENGFDIVEQDALSYLLEQKSGSLDIISGFHLIEHIPFDELLSIFSECYRVLRPGGYILFETPNPENISVGSWRFYYDPSHLHPLPPDMIAFAVKTCGFEKTEIMRLHPEEEMNAKLPKREREIQTRLFGPLDYAVIGEKWDEVSEL